MTQNAAPTADQLPSRRRRPQTRLGNRGTAALIDLSVPADAKRRRLTLANVSAVCEQLGEHVSTRNVQRILGGSLRDIGPLVQVWRENRHVACDAAAAGDQVQALGAILMGALQEHGAVVAAALKDQAKKNATAQQDLLDRVERMVGDRARDVAKPEPTRELPASRGDDIAGLKELRRNLQDLHAGVGRLLARGVDAAPAATAKDLDELGRRIDLLVQSVEQLQMEMRTSAVTDLEGLLAPAVQRLEALASTLEPIDAAPPAQTEVVVPALDRIEASLAMLATPKPAVRTQPSKAILSRLDTLLAATNELPAKLKAALKPQKRKRKLASGNKPIRKAGAHKAVGKKMTPRKTATNRSARKVVRKAVAKKRPTSAITAKKVARVKPPVKRTVLGSTAASRQAPAKPRKVTARKSGSHTRSARSPAENPQKTKRNATNRKHVSVLPRSKARTVRKRPR